VITPLDMTSTETEPAYGLRQYFRPLRRRWPYVVAGIALGVAAGIAANHLITKKYKATASVLVTPTGVDNTANSATGRTQTDINLDTEAQLVKSHAVADRARAALGEGKSAAALASHVSVAVPANTTVLRISYRAGSATRAQAAARAFAAAYLADRAASARAVLTGREAAIKTQMAAVARRLNAESSGPRRSRTASENVGISADKAQMAGLAKKLSEVTTTVVTPGRIITDAQLPSTPSGPGAALIVASGAMLGLLLGIAAAVVRDRTDPRVRDAARLDELGLPVLATLPPNGADTSRAYRRLSTFVSSASGDRGAAVLVANVSQGQANAGVARELAASLAAGGRTVSLLQADDGSFTSVRVQPTSEQLNGRPADRGEIDQRSWNDAPEQALRSLRESSEFVVVDAASRDESRGADSLAGSCDYVVFVVEAGTSRIDDVVDSVQQVQLIHGSLFGAVLTRGASARTRSAAAEGSLFDGRGHS